MLSRVCVRVCVFQEYVQVHAFLKVFVNNCGQVKSVDLEWHIPTQLV